ncbi:hypothetical protein HC776_03505 [bacterium]|nr:hypothetical protein [bacterium]
MPRFTSIGRRRPQIVFFQPQGIGKWFTTLYILNGGNSAYRRTVLEAVNGYAEKPAHMLEDRYLSQRLQEGGYKVRLLMQNKVWHTFRRFKKEGWARHLDLSV